MKTRSAARNQRIEQRETASKVVNLEQWKIDAEAWVKDGVVINPEFKEPSFDTFVKWKLIVTTAQNHPNILAHQDFSCVRDLCQFFGVYITYETSDLIVEFSVRETVSNVERGNESIHVLNSNGNEEIDTQSSLSCVFGRIDHFEVIPNLNAVRVSNYKLINDLKLSLADLVEFIWTVPEVLLYEKFNFVYEFLVKLGVSPDTITSEVYQTQCRRAQNKFPASTLLLKLGIPESTLVTSYDVNQYNQHHGSGSETSNNFGRRTSFSSQSEADSGIESWDNFESSTSVSPSPDFDTPSMTFRSPNQLVFAKKSKVVELIEEGPHEMDAAEFNDAADKQFKCTVCQKRYITKGNCNWHIRKRHPGACLLPGSKLFRQPKSYYCPFCGKAFTYPQYVNNHIERLHPESSSSNVQQKFNLHSAFKSKKMKALGNMKLRHQQRKKIASIVISANSRRGHHRSKKSLRQLTTSSKLKGL